MSRIGLSSAPQINFKMAARTLGSLETPMIVELLSDTLRGSSLTAATLSATVQHAGDSYEGPNALKRLLGTINSARFQSTPFVIPLPDRISIASLLPDWQGMQGALVAFSESSGPFGVTTINSILTHVSNMDSLVLQGIGEWEG